MSCLLENPQQGLHRDEFKLLRGGGGESIPLILVVSTSFGEDI